MLKDTDLFASPERIDTICSGFPFQKTIEQLSQQIAIHIDSKVAQYYLDFYNKRISPPSTVIKSYMDYFPLIRSIYDQKPRFHGTGRLRYAINGESKYGSEVKTDNVIDSLESVLEEGGLLPNSDPFVGVVSDAQQIDSQGIQKSISLSNSRIIAGLYSETHQSNNDPLQYRYGHPTFWKMYYLVQSLLADPISGSQDCLQVAFNGQYREYYTKWLKAIDNREDLLLRLLHGTPIYPFIASFKTHSRIEHNHGLLFGAVADKTPSLPIHNFFARFESRIPEPITIDKLTHIEVPLNKLVETSQRMKEFGYEEIPILPIECTELYMSRHKLDELFPWG